MSCPSCSLQLCRRLPLLMQRTASVSSFLQGSNHSMSVLRQIRPMKLDPVPAEQTQKDQNTRTIGLRKFVENITRKPKEARLWFKYFKLFSAKSPRRAFTVMQVAPEVLGDSSSVRKLAWSITFLFENHLTSVIVCRMADDADFQNLQLLQSLLCKHGVPSRLVLGTENSPEELLAVSHSTLPIVCYPVLGSGDECAQQSTMVHLCSTLRPLKVMLLSQQAGLRDTKGKVISDVYLPTDFDELVNSESHLSGEDQSKVLRSAELIKHLSCESSVILTSADTVIEELFTHHGTGTMIRQIEKIFRYSNLDNVKKPNMVALINESFQKKLRGNYFERVKGLVDAVYVSENYNAAAVILRLPNVSIPYLDKIAVSEIAQGTGISVMLWNQIIKDYPQLFWRSSVTNRAAIAWYNTVSQGSWKADQNWTVFWYGLQTSRQLSELIDYATRKEMDFEGTCACHE